MKPLVTSEDSSTPDRELRKQLLEALLHDSASEEQYVDTKAKFLIDDLVRIVQARETAARIDEQEYFTITPHFGRIAQLSQKTNGGQNGKSN